MVLDSLAEVLEQRETGSMARLQIMYPSPVPMRIENIMDPAMSFETAKRNDNLRKLERVTYVTVDWSRFELCHTDSKHIQILLYFLAAHEDLLIVIELASAGISDSKKINKSLSVVRRASSKISKWVIPPKDHLSL